MCAIVLLVLVPAGAEGIPSLYRNDEVWYRDALSPLAERDGEYYVPVGLCDMFDDIEVRSLEGDNLLLFNKKTGGYISALVSDGSAAVNGEIIKTTVFREGGTYYINSELVCSVLGIESETYTDKDGTTVMRLKDGECYFDLAELAERNRKYNNDPSDGYVPAYDTEYPDRKTIYILCEAELDDKGSVCDLLDRSLLEYTVFLTEEPSSEEIYYASSCGEYGVIYDGNADELDRINDKIGKYSMTSFHAVMTDCDEDEKSALAERGYAVITPDYTVDDRIYAYTAMKEIKSLLKKKDSVIIFIQDTWSGREIVKMISELDENEYKTANIRNRY